MPSSVSVPLPPVRRPLSTGRGPSGPWARHCPPTTRGSSRRTATASSTTRSGCSSPAPPTTTATCTRRRRNGTRSWPGSGSSRRSPPSCWSRGPGSCRGPSRRARVPSSTGWRGPAGSPTSGPCSTTRDAALCGSTTRWAARPSCWRCSQARRRQRILDSFTTNSSLRSTGSRRQIRPSEGPDPALPTPDTVRARPAAGQPGILNSTGLTTRPSVRSPVWSPHASATSQPAVGP